MFIPNTFTPETLKAVNAIIDESQSKKYSYYFSDATTAKEKAEYFSKHNHERIEWAEGGHYFSAEYMFGIGKYTKDGKQTTILAIKNSARRMEVILA